MAPRTWFSQAELRLAGLLAVATFLSGLASSALGLWWVDAGTARQTDVQLVQLAVGVLSQPLPDAPGETPETALREWAVDTINEAAEIKFDERARMLLISGEQQFEWLQSSWHSRQLTTEEVDKLTDLFDSLTEQQPDDDPGEP